MLREGIIVLGNSKMGKVLHINLPRGIPRGFGLKAFLYGTCPGASVWCLQNCYGIDKPPSEDISSIDAMNRAIRIALYKPREFVKKVIDEIEFYSREFLEKEFYRGEVLLRLHVVGDFYHPDYVNLWLELSDLLREKGVRIWSYTRSWWIDRVEKSYREIELSNPRKLAEELFDRLNELRRRSNVALYASTDHTMPDISRIAEMKEWLEAGIETTYRGNALTCPEIPCVACKYCVYGRGDIAFIERNKIRVVGKPWNKAFSEDEWRDFMRREGDKVRIFLERIRSLRSYQIRS
ncbi:MAG: hypothetical protein QXS89_06595 [Sulfolobales archaeon]